MDQLDQIMAYEAGELDDEEVVALFQSLIDSGLAWRLQGSYGRAAARLIEQGCAVLPNNVVFAAPIKMEIAELRAALARIPSGYLGARSYRNTMIERRQINIRLGELEAKLRKIEEAR